MELKLNHLVIFKQLPLYIILNIHNYVMSIGKFTGRIIFSFGILGNDLSLATFTTISQ